MAQIDWNQGPKPSRRFIHVVRQRPGLLLGVLGLMIACAIALVGGVAAGGGEVYISRDDASGLEPDRSRNTSSEQAVDDASSEAEPESSRGDGPLSDESEIQEVVVDVTGAVMAPTVARLPAGSRVDDAVLAAGGYAEDADLAAINRAALLVDGQKVHVPRVGEASAAEGSGSGFGQDVSAASDGSGLVNINTADASALDALPGVGPATAEAIIKDREENGPFASTEDIMRVSGIGEKKFENLKDAICV